MAQHAVDAGTCHLTMVSASSFCLSLFDKAMKLGKLDCPVPSLPVNQLYLLCQMQEAAAYENGVRGQRSCIGL